MDDRQMLERFRDGDAEAVRHLYERYGSSVAAVTRRALADASLADEATQQTFVQAWHAAGTLDPTRDPGPWLYTIARRVSVDLWRREERRSADSVDAGGATARAAEARLVSLPPSIDKAWDAWEIRRAVDELSPDEREIIRLHHFEDLSQAEIAERLSLPIGTVKSRSYRAHRRLAEALGHLAPRGTTGDESGTSGTGAP